MKIIHRLAVVVGLAALLGGCEGPCQKLDLGAPHVGSAQVDFSRFVAVGTSISAGFQSGGVVNRHQINAYPAIFARQIGKTVALDGTGSFSEPTVDGNGIPALLRLQGLYPAPDIAPPTTQGNPTNATYSLPYSNLAVPGAILFDLADSTRYSEGLFSLVLRGHGTIQEQLLSQNPTFISFEFGANEVLGAATAGSAKGNTAATSPSTYRALLQIAAQSIHSARPDVHMTITNVPDVTTIPYFATIPSTGLWGWVHGKTLEAPSPNPGQDSIVVATLGVADLVLLPAGAQLAAGFGLSASSPLDSSFVLDQAERAVINDATNALNAAIDEVAAAPWVAKVDLNQTLSNIHKSGYNVGGTHYTDQYISGGLFSLDGIHPTDLGHAIIANAMIEAVNRRFETSVPYARLLDYSTPTSSSMSPSVDMTRPLIPARIEGIEEILRLLFGFFH